MTRKLTSYTFLLTPKQAQMRLKIENNCTRWLKRRLSQFVRGTPMKHELIPGARFLRAGAMVVALVLGLATGCKNQTTARTDEQLTSEVQAKISDETALSGQNIQVKVSKGIATLSGTVT